jgi:hypothetical protein
LAASGLEACGTIRSAPPITKTAVEPIAGRRVALWRISFTAARKIEAEPSRTGHSLFSRRDASSSSRASSSFWRRFWGVEAPVGAGSGKNQ